uniref:Uncharacterized protein n=1 Tax=mine drainage metagenome TaxID=410659 RepID=E6QIR5_9ZZZZ
MNLPVAADGNTFEHPRKGPIVSPRITQDVEIDQ